MSGNIMNASVMGMNAQTSWLATISQNIANSSTTGYKDAETQFNSLVDQTGASSYSAGGVATNSVSMNSMQGGIVGTSTVTDLAVQGAGFFVVTNSSGDTFLTRNGSFVPDANGNLVNSAGYYLMGTNIQNGAGTPVANSLSNLQMINTNQTGEQATATTLGTLSVNLPSSDAVVASGSTPATGGSTFSEKTSLITYDNLGAPVTLDVYFTNVGANPPGTPNWEVDVYNQADAAPGGGFPYANPAITSQTLTFNPLNGQLATGSPLSIAIPNGQTMNLNLGSTTQLAAGFIVNSAITNGNAPDTLTGVSISTNGTLAFNYSSGNSLPGYNIPLVNVASPNSLTSINGTVYQTNVNSGQPQVGVAGSGGLGSIESSSLESSTVDLATQLTDMIQAQSSYQANSKVFQAGANLLDILNKLQA